MVAETSSHITSGSGPLKRQLFNKPSWSKPQALTNRNDLFHRSNQTYVDLADEAERQRKWKLARKERERAIQVETVERAGKRQRVSESEEDDDDGSASDQSSHKSENEKGSTRFEQAKSQHGDDAVRPAQYKNSPKSLLRRYEATVTAGKIDLDQKQKPSASHIINLENEDEDEDDPIDIVTDSTIAPATGAKRTVPPVEEENETMSDDEFPELARQAREKARRKRPEEDMASATPVSPSMSQINYQQRSQPTSQSTPPPPPPDPVLDLLITSNIPNTEPLIIKRKLSQRLKDVKLAWAERQHFSQVFTDSVFLIWRGKRIFDHTTCRSLGYRFSSDGRIMASRDNMMDDEGRVHMEVVTREMFEASKKAKVNDVLDGEKDKSEGLKVEEQKREAQVKIICKAKGFSDFKLIVKPVRIRFYFGFRRD